MNEFVYERRFGARNQFEIVIPFGYRERTIDGEQDWVAGLGDVVLGVKHALFHSHASGSILSTAAEIKLPTGDETDGFGSGTSVFEAFVSYGQLLPADAISAVDEARERHLLWLRPSGATCVFVHDRVRSVFLDRLSPGKRSELHRRVARLLQERAPDRVFDLAYHFDAASDINDPPNPNKSAMISNPAICPSMPCSTSQRSMPSTREETLSTASTPKFAAKNQTIF